MKKARDTEGLRTVITTRGLSYRQLGKLADCSHTTLFLLVQGKTTSNDLAARIARALGAPIGDLFEDAVSSDEQQITSREAVA